MKNYPLIIKNAGEDMYAVMSKGHHDPQEFMREVRKDYSWPLGYPEHLWAKATPDVTGDKTCLYHFVNSSVRGSFPVTYSFEAYGEDSYEYIVENEGDYD